MVADVGAGTGFSSEPFLRLGYTVYAVEPNGEMRRAAEEWLGPNPHFHSLTGTAEATALPDNAVDFVAAGQAFHWFDHSRASTEFRRILKPRGYVALFWNSRRKTSTAFLLAYETLLRQFGTDYKQVSRRTSAPAFEKLFGGEVQRKVFFNEQQFDFTGLQGRLLSSSYSPSQNHPNHAPMIETLAQVFQEHEEHGRVTFEYDTELCFGHVKP